ncbi:hypothetical protein E2C01_086296 [Portunus trituberculatus]|uniref:Uncharacterized protein n=1 Tax=Portunus trituberculatus TaxID=210409 RepID=A0A5B7J521_PORTR|nr:hypothetical protein [Portunus trituberculatus]
MYRSSPLLPQGNVTLQTNLAGVGTDATVQTFTDTGNTKCSQKGAVGTQQLAAVAGSALLFSVSPIERLPRGADFRRG